MELQPFQKRFDRAVYRKTIDTVALSMPRGNGKSFLAGRVLAKALTPNDGLFIPGTESVLMAGSIEQARIVFRFARKVLDARALGDYRYIDSATRVAILHKRSNTRLRVIGSNGRTAMGLVDCPLAVCDEPGAWETKGGELLHDAVETAMGKPGSPMKVVYIGTLAPSVSGWWHDLISRGSFDTTYVQLVQGKPGKWTIWREVMRANPLAKIAPEMQKKLRQELEAAKNDTRLKARFLSYRLNLPTADESCVLLTVDDWNAVQGRQVQARAGRPIVGVDMGENRAWSSAVAIWSTGRIEAFAVAPGLPTIEAQEKRDLVPCGTYRNLVQKGSLLVAEGLRVPKTKTIIREIRRKWGIPARVVCDRFREAKLSDSINGICPIEIRIQRWSDASEDIRALRAMAYDGPLNVDHKSRAVLTASLAVATVKTDDAGNIRMVKKANNNTARDDVAVALMLAAGAHERASRIPTTRIRTMVVGGSVN